MTRATKARLLLGGLLSLGAAILASCAGQHPPPPPETAAVQPSPQPTPYVAPPPHRVPRPAHKPNPPPATTEGAAAEAGDQDLAMIAPEPAARSPGPGAAAPLQTQQLIGLDQAATTRLLGTAAERSEEPPATVWRYKTATCELDLFFYFDLRSGQMRTLHYAFKGEATDSARRQNCLRELVAARGS